MDGVVGFWSDVLCHPSLLNVHLFIPQAQIAFLQGERRGQENLKKDLVRRIKMLEYALKQERLEYTYMFKSLSYITPQL